MNLKQMSLNELLNLDASRLTGKEVEYIEKRLSRTANLRRNKLIQNKLKGYSPSLKRYAKKEFRTLTEKDVKEYKYKVDGKTYKRRESLRNKQLENISRMKQFLTDPTSTVKGSKKLIDTLQNLIKTVSGSDRTLNKRELKRFFNIWEKAQELLGGTTKADKNTGSPVWKQLVELLKSSSSDKYIKNENILDILNDTINGEYEKAQTKINELNQEDNIGLEVDEIDAFK